MIHQWVIGIDEAGRGPLAGPVAVGICAVDKAFDFTSLRDIRDSKTLSEKQREMWYKKLTALPHLRWAVGLTSATLIDRKGIQFAVRDALARGLTKVNVPITSCVLLDGGLHAPTQYRTQQTIIHGDAIEPLISAAAILAKVTRDRLMVRLGKKYPEYGFAVHKGYGTAAHRKAIVEYGLSRIHRVSFCSRIIEITNF
jgi:ribonuclease HII